SPCIPVDKNDIGACFFHDAIKTLNRPGCNLCQCLSMFHHIQIIVRINPEDRQHLIKHFPMLCGYGNDRFKHSIALLQFKYERSHFNRFRPCPENHHYFTTVCNPSSLQFMLSLWEEFLSHISHYVV